MVAVDVSTWMEFRVGDLFEIYHGSRLTVAARIDGDVSFVTAGYENQGVVGCIGNDVATYHDPITVDMFGNCFAHMGDYAGDDNVYFFVNDEVPYAGKLYVSTVMNKVLDGQHSYKLQFRQGHADALHIKLPTTNDGQPDWAYMEAYMGSVMERQAAVVDALSRMATEKRPVDVGSWVEFDLIGEDGIFTDYERGKVSVARDLDDGNTPYVGAVFPKNNNGVQRYVTPKSEGQVTKGNCLVMVCDGAAIGCNMYQPSDFVGTTNLKIVRDEHLNELTGLFLASALDASARRSGYSYFWKRNDENIRKEKIKLPATLDGEPDWAYMEEYMRTVMERQEHVVEHLSQICEL